MTDENKPTTPPDDRTSPTESQPLRRQIKIGSQRDAPPARGSWTPTPASPPAASPPKPSTQPSASGSETASAVGSGEGSGGAPAGSDSALPETSPPTEAQPVQPAQPTAEGSQAAAGDQASRRIRRPLRLRQHRLRPKTCSAPELGRCRPEADAGVSGFAHQADLVTSCRRRSTRCSAIFRLTS
jgi:hypothetical protein